MTAINLSEEQRQLLWKIHQYSETSRRTDKLATCMRSLYGNKWDNSHVAFIGLQLRTLGLVTTFKDNSDYARWDASPSGHALAVETKNVGSKAAKEAPVTVPTKVEYLVLPKGKNINSYLRFGNEEEATHKAKYLADLNGYDYEVVQTQVVATVKYTPAVAAKVEVTKP